jgi:hypothetical protein
MSPESSKSPLDFFAELGNLLARYAANPTYAVMMVIIGWVIWPIGALIASLLIASVYARAQKAAEPGTQPASENSPKLQESDWLILIGLGLIALGLHQWLRHYMDIPWPLVLIALGVLTILLAFARRAGGGAAHG